jgi:hypothetical protein
MRMRRILLEVSQPVQNKLHEQRKKLYKPFG